MMMEVQEPIQSSETNEKNTEKWEESNFSSSSF